MVPEIKRGKEKLLLLVVKFSCKKVRVSPEIIDYHVAMSGAVKQGGFITMRSVKHRQKGGWNDITADSTFRNAILNVSTGSRGNKAV